MEQSAFKNPQKVILRPKNKAMFDRIERVEALTHILVLEAKESKDPDVAFLEERLQDAMDILKQCKEELAQTLI